MSLLANNLKALRKKMGLTQGALAERMGIKRSLIGSYEEGRAEPRLNNLIKMAEVFDTPIDHLVLVDMSVPDMGKASSLIKRASGAGLRVLSIAVAESGEDLVPLVPQKAAAGYLQGYADGEYLQELPQFKLPNLPKNASYRAFEVMGDSMLPILSGTIVIGRYLEDWHDIKSGDTYILLTREEGIVYKRVFNYIEESQKLFLVSDNRNYAPYEISIEDVLEVWAAKAFISVSFPDPGKDPQWSLEKLTSMVLELQQEVTKLKS